MQLRVYLGRQRGEEVPTETMSLSPFLVVFVQVAEPPNIHKAKILQDEECMHEMHSFGRRHIYVLHNPGICTILELCLRRL